MLWPVAELANRLPGASVRSGKEYWQAGEEGGTTPRESGYQCGHGSRHPALALPVLVVVARPKFISAFADHGSVSISFSELSLFLPRPPPARRRPATD